MVRPLDWLSSHQLPQHANAWGNAVAQLHPEHRQTFGNMLRSIQMLIALHRSKRWAFAEWIGTELETALDKAVKS